MLKELPKQLLGTYVVFTRSGLSFTMCAKQISVEPCQRSTDLVFTIRTQAQLLLADSQARVLILIYISVSGHSYLISVTLTFSVLVH